MESPDTFTQLPLHLDPKTKALTSTDPNAGPSLLAELASLNALHRSLLSLDTTPAAIPPPPVPVNPKRSAQIAKLREAGNAHFKAGKYADAARHYTLGIEMALGRPAWEPAGLVREELSTLYANRSQAYMAVQSWPEGAIDAQCSVELKKVQNGKAWWRRGRCLVEMGRVEEAATWVAEALEFEQGEKELLALKGEIDTLLAKKERR